MDDEVKGRDLAARKGSRSKGSGERELIHILQRAKTWGADDLSEAGKEEGADGERSGVWRTNVYLRSTGHRWYAGCRR